MCLGIQGVGMLFLKQLRAAETAHPGTCSSECDPQNPHKSLGMVTCKMGGRDRWTPGAHWPASLTFLAKFQSSERSCLKQKVEAPVWRMSQAVFWPPQSCTHAYLYIQENTYTNQYILNRLTYRKESPPQHPRVLTLVSDYWMVTAVHMINQIIAE